MPAAPTCARPSPRCALASPRRSPHSPTSRTTTAGRGRPVAPSCSRRSIRTGGTSAAGTPSGSSRRSTRTGWGRSPRTTPSALGSPRPAPPAPRGPPPPAPMGGGGVGGKFGGAAAARGPLLLLDADRPENDVADRWITSRLYVGDAAVRLAQYAVLGIGGVRALEALGVEPGVVHLNEGHAALACLELARLEHSANGAGPDEALEAVRRRIVFTTHTPVPAGNDTYPAGDMGHMLAGVAGELGTAPDR